MTTFNKLRGQNPTLDRVQDNIDKAMRTLGVAPKWIAVPGPYSNGWTALVNSGNVGSKTGLAPAIAYLKDASGIVRLRGVPTGGTVAAGTTGTIFTLPAGYRPAYEEHFACSDGATYVLVQDTGDVRCFTSANAFVYLSGIAFLAER